MPTFNELFGVIPAKRLVGDRFAYVVAGPGGTGKSTLLGSMAKQYKCLLLATLPREAASWLYREVDIETVPLWESGFYTDNPETGYLPEGLKLQAFQKFLRITEALRNDETYDGIILDNGTELAEIAWHNAMMPHKVISPAYMEDKKSRFLPYETLATNLDQAVKNLVSLANGENAKRPKFVGIAWHVQPPREDQVETVGEGMSAIRRLKASADHASEGVEYEGKVLPMIRGGFRRKLSSQVDAFVFTDIHYEKKESGARLIKIPRYVIQVQPDEERHAKVPGPMSAVKYIPNDFQSLYKLVKEGRVAETAAVAPTGSSSGGGKSPLRRP